MGSTETKEEAERAELLLSEIEKGTVLIDACDIDRSFDAFSEFVPEKGHSYSGARFFFAKIRERINDVFLKVLGDTKEAQTEITIYRNYVSRILNERKSPCFLRFFAFAKCSGFLKKAEEKTGQSGEIFDPVNLLVLERVYGGLTLYSWLTKERHSDEEIFVILLMILYSLVILSEANVSHRDLHANNILLKHLREPVPFLFALRDEPNLVFAFRSAYVPLIYDWDHAEVPSTKENVDAFTILCQLQLLLRRGRSEDHPLRQFFDRIMSQHVVILQCKVPTMNPRMLSSEKKEDVGYWLKSIPDVLLDSAFDPYRIKSVELSGTDWHVYGSNSILRLRWEKELVTRTRTVVSSE